MKKYYLWKFDGVHLNSLNEEPPLAPVLDKDENPVLDEVGNPMMKLDPQFVEVECEPTDDIVTNFIFYKVDNTGQIVKMDDEEFYTVHPNYGKGLPSPEEQQTDFNLDVDYRLSCLELGLI